MKIIPLAIAAQSAIFEFQAVNGSIQVEARRKTSVRVSTNVGIQVYVIIRPSYLRFSVLI